MDCMLTEFPLPGSQIFEPLGLLSGLFFTFATANSFAAISSLGLSIASGVW